MIKFTRDIIYTHTYDFQRHMFHYMRIDFKSLHHMSPSPFSTLPQQASGASQEIACLQLIRIIFITT